MSFHHRWIKLALKVALKSTHPRHLLGCVVVKGGAVVASAPNTLTWGAHAERRALRPTLDLKDGVAYVMRSNRCTSRPCPTCWTALVEAGIHSVVFVDQSGNICKERV